MEENVFPLSRAAEDQDELEEERRLAYVGITRAEKILYLTNANSRLLFGRTNYNRPTRFINEISSDLLEYQVWPDQQIQALKHLIAVEALPSVKV